MLYLNLILNANLKQNLNYLKPKLNIMLNLNLYYA